MRFLHGDGGGLQSRPAENSMGFQCIEKPVSSSDVTSPSINVPVKACMQAHAGVVKENEVKVDEKNQTLAVTIQMMHSWHFLGLDTSKTLQQIQEIHGSKCVRVKEENNSGMHYQHWEATRYDGTSEGVETTNYGGRQEITRYWDTARQYDALRISAKYQGNRSIIVHHRVRDVNLKLIYSATTGQIAYIVGYVETIQYPETTSANKTRCNFTLTFCTEIDIMFFDHHTYKYEDYAACCGPTGDRSLYRRIWQAKHPDLLIQYPRGCSRNWNPSANDIINALHGHEDFRFARAPTFTSLLMAVYPRVQNYLDESTWLRVFQCDEFEGTLFPSCDSVASDGYEVRWRQGESMTLFCDKVSLLKRPMLNDVCVIRERICGDGESETFYWAFPDHVNAAQFALTAFRFSFLCEQNAVHSLKKKPFATCKRTSRSSSNEIYTYTSLLIEGVGEPVDFIGRD
jgi:hypothetical protein